MRSSICSLVLVAVLLGAGCKKGPELVGKWTASAGAQTVEVEFLADNTFTMGSSNMKVKGDYKRDGEKLTLTTKDIEMPSLPPALLAKAKALPSFGKPKDATVKFVNDDEVSISGITPTGGPGTDAITLKRVKG